MQAFLCLRTGSLLAPGTINQMISINLDCLLMSNYFQDGKVGHVFVSNFCRPQVQAKVQLAAQK